MAKKIEFEGQRFIVGFTQYGFSNSAFVINGEMSSIHIRNSDLNNVDVFKEHAKEAIIEYKDRKIAQVNFEKWDGKI